MGTGLESEGVGEVSENMTTTANVPPNSECQYVKTECPDCADLRRQLEKETERAEKADAEIEEGKRLFKIAGSQHGMTNQILEGIMKERDQLKSQLAERDALIERLRAAIRERAWTDGPYYGQHFCQFCGALYVQHRDHEPNCIAAEVK